MPEFGSGIIPIQVSGSSSGRSSSGIGTGKLNVNMPIVDSVIFGLYMLWSQHVRGMGRR